MIGAIICAIFMGIGVVVAESWHEYPNYEQAGLIVWEQFVAIMTYYWIWVRPKLKELNEQR